MLRRSPSCPPERRSERWRERKAAARILDRGRQSSVDQGLWGENDATTFERALEEITRSEIERVAERFRDDHLTVRGELDGKPTPATKAAAAVHGPRRCKQRSGVCCSPSCPLRTPTRKIVTPNEGTTGLLHHKAHLGRQIGMASPLQCEERGFFR